MDNPKDNDKGKVVSLDFARRARAEKAAPPAPAPSGNVMPAMVFTDYELQQMTRAFEIGKAAGVLDRFDTVTTGYGVDFRMFQSGLVLPSVCVSRRKYSKMIEYKCWSSYNGHQNEGEGPNFEPLMASVRAAVKGLIDHVGKSTGRTPPRP